MARTNLRIFLFAKVVFTETEYFRWQNQNHL